MTDRLRVGLVGYGRWGQKLLNALLTVPGVEVCAVCDPALFAVEPTDPATELRAELTQRAGAGLPAGLAAGLAARVRIFSSAQPMLNAIALDALVIATPSDSHAVLALLALDHGLHVFVEKPLALSVRDAEALVRVANTRRRLLMVGHILHHDASVSMAYRLLHAGAIGTLRSFIAERCNTNPADAMSAWWELAPHDIAVCSRSFGSEPKWVEMSAQGSLARASLGYANGVARLQVGFAGPRVRRTAWIGDEGALLLQEEPGQGLQLRQLHQVRLAQAFYERPALLDQAALWSALDQHVIGSARVELPTADALRGELSHFVYCALNASRPISDGIEGLAVVRVLAAGEQAMKTGRRIVGRSVAARSTLDGTLEPDA